MKKILFITLIFYSQLSFSQSFVDAGIPNYAWQIRDICIDSIGNKMFTVGFHTLDGSMDAALNTVYVYDGFSWTTLDTVYDMTYSVAIYNGELYIGGGYIDTNGVNQPYLSKWNGSKWEHFGDTIDGPVYGLKVIDTSLFVMGGFSKIGGFNCNGIALWNGSTWSSIYSIPFVSSGYSIVDCDIYNGDLYICGNFYDVPSNIVDIAKFNGISWEKVGDVDCIKGSGSIWDMEIYKNELYVGGFIKKDEGNIGHGIQKWNGITWLEVGSGLQDNNNLTSGWVAAETFVKYKGKLFVGGIFWYAGNVYSRGLSTWDGNEWCSVDTMYIGTSCMAIFNDTLFVSSGPLAEDTIAGTYVNNLAKFTDLTPDSCSIGFGVDEIENSSKVVVFPNPNNGNFTIQFEKSSQNGTITVTNSIGEIILTKEMNFEKEILFNMSIHPKGIYLISIRSDEYLVTKKIILE